MKAPEKIYISPLHNHSDGYVGVAWGEPHKTMVEYTRTDAFIDKACEFFEEYIKEEDCKFGSSEWTELRAEYESLDSFIRAFKNYMEGE